jgi:2,4-dienoyl-CoA reductase-like NADH-dependent reductase (Old Yellow Enzyme family)
MTRQMSPGGVPGPDVAAYYARRAANGVGLIIGESAFVDHPAASNSDQAPRFHGADALAGWANVIDAVHAAGGRMVPQLHHVGMDPLDWGRSADGVGGATPSGVPHVSPSGITPDGDTGPAMTESDIADVISSFARAATQARRLGFDGIEVHGAHGYLIDQFLWSTTNRRTDHYGGDLARRGRFCADIIRACRAAVGAEFPIVLRFSQWKVGHYSARLADGPAELEAFLAPLVAAGVDMFHCSTRRFWRPEFPGSDLNLAGWVKKLTGVPTITVGSVGLKDSDFLTYLDGQGAATDGVDAVIDRLARGEFDLIAVGRALIADPAWAGKVRSGQLDQLIPFSADMLTTLR